MTALMTAQIWTKTRREAQDLAEAVRRIANGGHFTARVSFSEYDAEGEGRFQPARQPHEDDVQAGISVWLAQAAAGDRLTALYDAVEAKGWLEKHPAGHLWLALIDSAAEYALVPASPARLVPKEEL
jgi:hypothetical protein